MSLGEAEWIAVDWGTSNLRAWGIGACGDVMFSRTSDQGMSKLTPDAYPRRSRRPSHREFSSERDRRSTC